MHGFISGLFYPIPLIHVSVCIPVPYYIHDYIVAVQPLSQVQLFATPWTAACQASLSFTVSWSLLKLLSIESVMTSNHPIDCHPLLLLPSIFPRIRVFSNGSVLRIRWPNYWSFSFSISPSNKYSGMIQFRIDWFYLFAIQWNLKSLLQHYSSNALIPWHSVSIWSNFHIHIMITGKTIALTRWAFLGKAISLIFDMLV